LAAPGDSRRVFDPVATAPEITFLAPGVEPAAA
jgi:hypothetical protein